MRPTQSVRESPRSLSRAERTHQRLILLSPFAVIALGQLAARAAGPRLGTWAWAFLFAGYWVVLACLLVWGGGRQAISRWLAPSQGSRVWPVLAVAFAVLSTVWMVVPNWQLLLRAQVLLPTLLFVLINPCLEEGYWRGLLIDAAASWPRWLAILYSAGLSAINHLWLMVVVVAARNPAVSAYQFVLGLLMGAVYVETQSLRWPIVAHLLTNLFSLSVAMFLNLYVPGAPG